MQQNSWKSMKPLSNSITAACSTSCKGYWYSMTGDFAKASEYHGRRKPANRQASPLLSTGLKGVTQDVMQVYRYNLTSGEAFEVNGEKQRGGAGCGYHTHPVLQVP